SAGFNSRISRTVAPRPLATSWLRVVMSRRLGGAGASNGSASATFQTSSRMCSEGLGQPGLSLSDGPDFQPMTGESLGELPLPGSHVVWSPTEGEPEYPSRKRLVDICIGSE